MRHYEEIEELVRDVKNWSREDQLNFITDRFYNELTNMSDHELKETYTAFLNFKREQAFKATNTFHLGGKL